MVVEVLIESRLKGQRQRCMYISTQLDSADDRTVFSIRFDSVAPTSDSGQHCAGLETVVQCVLA